jgi:hypothetical protein
MVLSGRVRRLRYILPFVHASLFAAGCFFYVTHNEAFMSGKNESFFSVLWVADIPISIFCWTALVGADQSGLDRMGCCGNVLVAAHWMATGNDSCCFSSAHHVNFQKS